MIGTSPARDTSQCDFVVNSEEHCEGRRSAHSPVRDACANDALGDAVRRVLQATGYLPLRNIDVEVGCGGVRLAGAVTSYHLKQMAQSVVMRLPGVGRVVNAIEVVGGS
jgi:osmotically-inducible protein OsmY